MIINIRGTSGSGKSTVIREIMKLYDSKKPHMITKRKQPFYYTLRKEGVKPLIIMGHYETACGGCDTINKQSDIFDTIRSKVADGFNVVFEGLLISGEVTNTSSLKSVDDLLVISMDVPLEVCVASVNERRWRKDPSKPPVNPKNTEAKWKGVKLASQRLTDNGVRVVWADRDESLRLMKEALGHVA